MTNQTLIIKFLVIFPVFLALISLSISLLIKDNQKNRSFVLVTISVLFLLNIIVIDYLFICINNCIIHFTLLNIGKYSIMFKLEPLGITFLTMLALIWSPALLYTIKFIEFNQLKKTSKYLFFFNLCILLGCILALSGNLITMFVIYELLTLCTIPLIVHHFDKKSLKGLYKYLKILLLSSTVLLLPAIVIIYSKIGNGTFITEGFIKPYFSDSFAIFLLLLFIFGISKAALYPFHSWLPAAMVASYPVSALLHAVVITKSGLFCVYKIFLYVFGLNYLQCLFNTYNWLLILPAISILYSSFQALKCKEIKMVLAYSTINQLSIALISAFLFTPKGLIASVVHMISHSFTKISLFYSAANFYSLKKVYYLNDLKGIKNFIPKTSVNFFLASLSLVGIPPFAGFISKFYIISAAVDIESFLVVTTIIISNLLSGSYIFEILSNIYMKAKIKNNIEKNLPISMLITLVIFIVVISFFFPIPRIISFFLKAYI